jgi:hypothetical protein
VAGAADTADTTSRVHGRVAEVYGAVAEGLWAVCWEGDYGILPLPLQAFASCVDDLAETGLV